MTSIERTPPDVVAAMIDGVGSPFPKDVLQPTPMKVFRAVSLSAMTSSYGESVFALAKKATTWNRLRTR